MNQWQLVEKFKVTQVKSGSFIIFISFYLHHYDPFTESMPGITGGTQYWSSKWFWEMALYMLKHRRQTVFNKKYDTKAVASHRIQTLVLTADSKFINDLQRSYWTLYTSHLQSWSTSYKMLMELTTHADSWFWQNHMNSEMRHKVVLVDGIAKCTLAEALTSSFQKIFFSLKPSPLCQE